MADATSSDEGSDSEQELTGSKLGKQSYWEQAYKEEIANLDETGDEGEVWFGREVLKTSLQFTEDVLKRCFPSNYKEQTILDVGCGNGTMLIGLAARGFKELSGGDYSIASLQLASKVLQRHGIENVYLFKQDLLNCDYGDGVAVITDKGTLDAIGLSDNAEVNRKKYRSSIWHLLDPCGILIITSCNSTREELVEEFCNPAANRTCAFNPDRCRHTPFKVLDYVKSYPTFKFGGVEGSKVCTVAFMKELPYPGGIPF